MNFNSYTMKFPATHIVFLILLFVSQGLLAQQSIPDLSTRLIKSIYEEKPTKKLTDRISAISLDKLSSELDSDAKKKTFWINIYNSYVILILKENPELWDDRGSFFSEPRIEIAGMKLSFDDIEHGILRRSKPKWTLGFIPNPFAKKFERKFRVDEVDPRIHFVLNCGAISCPPVRFLELDRMEEQLDLAARTYLEKVTEINQTQDKVATTPLMQWFRGDFGVYDGPKGTLRHFGIIEDNSIFNLSFKSYDWTRDLDNFQP